MDVVREKFVPVSFEIAYVNRRPDAEGRFFREKPPAEEVTFL